MTYVVRPATDADLPAVAEIYAHAVETSTASFDSVGPGVEVWKARLDSDHPLDLFLVAAHGDEVIGFAYSSSYRPKPAYDRTRETTIYLTSSARGQGVGRELYAELLERLRAGGCHSVIGVLAVPNVASERLHASLGFEEVGRIREAGHKFDQWLDIALWQRILEF